MLWMIASLFLDAYLQNLWFLFRYVNTYRYIQMHIRVYTHTYVHTCIGFYIRTYTIHNIHTDMRTYLYTYALDTYVIGRWLLCILECIYIQSRISIAALQVPLLLIGVNTYIHTYGQWTWHLTSPRPADRAPLSRCLEIYINDLLH